MSNNNKNINRIASTIDITNINRKYDGMMLQLKVTIKCK